MNSAKTVAANARTDQLMDIQGVARALKRDGFVKLERFLPVEALLECKKQIMSSAVYREWDESRAEDDANVKMTTAIDATHRHYRNDSDLAEGFFTTLCTDPGFVRTLTTLTGRSLIRVNNHVYEIVTGNSGLDWHVGYYSFSYTRPDDYGCTLWIPMEPITKEQRGGMQYISKSVLDGSFLYRFAAWHFEMLKKQPPGEKYLEMATSSQFMVNVISSLINPVIPPDQIVEDTFEVGDAFLFDKHVLHRSSPLLRGALKTRMALICRFVDVDALYDRRRFYSTFSHLEKSMASVRTDVSPRVADDENETISPQDPFLLALARDTVAHLTPIRNTAPIVNEAHSRLLERSPAIDTPRISLAT
ncbi:phytanoyl-CoA dioxygenase family protein [Pendulispora albinea]|uniref:Phytanoyl-CoA dioxygenase family protein n=1 Tax=Pendulispora albinea TaxID=2741071 RepID=A0ABZ2M3J3_9BACT